MGNDLERCKYCNRIISKMAFYRNHDNSSGDSLTNILIDTSFIPSSVMDLQGTQFEKM